MVTFDNNILKVLREEDKITIKEGKVYFIWDKFSSVEITKGKNTHVNVGNKNT